MNLKAGHLQQFDVELLPEREEDYVLKDVFEKEVYGTRAELIFDFGDCYLKFGVDNDTDQIVPEFNAIAFRKGKTHRSLQRAEPWKQAVGQRIGWTWLAMNQQGYCDTAMLSFGDIVPSIMLHVLGSSVQIFEIKERSEGTKGGDTKRKS